MRPAALLWGAFVLHRRFPFVKASPLGRGVTEGDGEGKPGKIEPLCSDKQTFCQSEPSPRSKFFYQRPCPLRRFAPALPEGEP